MPASDVLHFAWIVDPQPPTDPGVTIVRVLAIDPALIGKDFQFPRDLSINTSVGPVIETVTGFYPNVQWFATADDMTAAAASVIADTIGGA